MDAELRRGEAAYKAGRFTEATEIFAPLVLARPDDAVPIRMLGLCCLRFGDVPIAVSLLEAAYALAPDDPWTMIHYGIGLQAAGRNREAVELYRRAVPLLPDNPAPLVNLVGALLALGETIDALRTARRARFHAPGSAQVQYTYGLACLAGKFWARAAEAFGAAVRLEPRFVDGWVNLGLARCRMGDLAGAQAATDRALVLDPAHRAAAANVAELRRLQALATQPPA